VGSDLADAQLVGMSFAQILMGTRQYKMQLRRAYWLMRAQFGHQHWWPGETAFEVCVGAILTQNTNWTNVERAIANLKSAGVLLPRGLYALSPERLCALIRPAGYYNVKATRLRAFLSVLLNYCPESDAQADGNAHRRVYERKHQACSCARCAGSAAGRLLCLDRLFAGETPVVRRRLLEIPGLGPETADSMLLYAGGHLSFVVDAYTKRIFSRHGWVVGTGRTSTYDELKELCESALRDRPAAELLDYWQDYHAQLVMVGKRFCRARTALCRGCPLEVLLHQNTGAKRQ